MSRVALIASVVFVAAGCILLEGEGDAARPAMTGDGEVGIWRPRRSRKATWLLVRIWSGPVEASQADDIVPELAVESLKEDVTAAGLRVATDIAPDGPHEALLLRRKQSGFVAIARGEEVPAFEVAGRPIGGGGTRADVGFEIVGEPLKDGTIRLEMAPLFRRISGFDDDEIRATALSFVAELRDGQTLRFTSPEGARDSAIRALFAGSGGRRRRLWVQVKTL